MRPQNRATRPLSSASIIVLLILSFGTTASAFAMEPAVGGPLTVDRILPEGIDYDPRIPTPESVLGFEVGERHVRHDQLVTYMETLAAASDRVTLHHQGRTHGLRPLLYLTITSTNNHGRLETLRRRHLARLSGETDAGRRIGDEEPVVVWLGYSIHGNEASGSNASLLVAYHLAAARDREVETLLDDVVVLIDPSLNPDGLARFAHWANMHRGRQAVSDPMHREHREPWPNGRTNYYWYDLNRDWLLLQHPESRARVATLQRWRPNVVADFHEMGSDSTYFFQPGVPSRKNPLTPEDNVRLTEAIARFHAETLDRHGRLYYSEETFDDFYYGKGSTYPDVQGSVGILFEQASARGHRRETVNGVMDFRFAVSNQFLTSLSTLEGARAHRRKLLSYQADFVRSGMEEARENSSAGWVFGDAADPARGHLLAEILKQHGIRVHRLAREVERDGRTFHPSWAWTVPREQPQSRLAHSIFETVTEFEDSTFYDVSTWTLPLAFGVPSATLASADAVGEAADVPFPEGRLVSLDDDAPPPAWVFEWHGYFAPRALGELLRRGITARVATRPFTARVAGSERFFDYGTVVIPRGLQTQTVEDVAAALERVSRDNGVTVYALASGLTSDGVDLGSPSVRPLEKPRPLLVVGPGISTYDAGEIWHLLDHRFHLELSLVESTDLDQLDWSRYSHVILADGSYDGAGEALRQQMAGWVRRGGVLVALQRAAHWVEESVFQRDERPEPPAPGDDDRPLRAPYADYDEDRAEELVSGTIFKVDLDLTHPLAFGYTEPTLPVFRDSTRILSPSPNPYENVAIYPGDPLLSGYVSGRNLGRIAGSAAVLARREGRGAVIRLADNPTFRGFWYGTQKLLLNSIFFGPVLERTSPPETWE